MTREQAARLSEFYRLIAEHGAERIEVMETCCGAIGWEPLRNLHHQSSDTILGWVWRVKPVQQHRPWKSEEVPIGAQIRKIGCTGRSLILSSSEDYGIGQVVVGSDSVYKESFEKALGIREHSLDNGLTWKPCGVLE